MQNSKRLTFHPLPGTQYADPQKIPCQKFLQVYLPLYRNMPNTHVTYIKELAMLFPKTIQKYLGKRLHYTYFISLTMQLFQDGCPSLPTEVMGDINFIPSNLSLAVRLSYQQAVLLSAGKNRGEQIKAAFEGKQLGQAAALTQFCFQPGDKKQIPMVHLNRELACHYKYFIGYMLRTPQQLTANHLLSTCAAGLPSSLVRLFS